MGSIFAKADIQEKLVFCCENGHSELQVFVDLFPKRSETHIDEVYTRYTPSGYRCQTQQYDFLIKYPYMTDEDIMRAAAHSSVSSVFVKLKKYWRSDSYDKMQFIACEKCITPDVIAYFTHIPGGWKEDVAQTHEYESIKLGDSLHV